MQAGSGVPRLSVTMARDDAIRGIGVPAKWRRTDADMAAEAEARAKEAAAQRAAMEASQVAQIAGQAGDAAQSLQASGIIPALGTESPGDDVEGLPDEPEIEDIEFEEVA